MESKGLTFFKKYWQYLLFVIIGSFVYEGVFNNDFINFDDHLQLTENYRVQILNFESIKILFTTSSVNMYQPLTSLIFAILFRFAKFNAGYYHVFSLCIHILNTFLVYNFIIYLFKNKTKAIIASLFFLVHPVMVESVLWLSATSTMLYVFFFFSTAYTYSIYCNTNKNKYYYISILLFLLGLLCKIQIISFVAITFLIDWYFNKKIFSLKNVLRKVPFIILTSIFIVVALTFRSSNHEESILVNYPIWLLTPNQIIWYVFKYILPYNLGVLYDWPINFKVREYLFTAFFLTIPASLYFLRKNRLFVFGILFFLITVGLHTSLFIRFLAPYADRYGYLAFVGFIISILSFNFSKNTKYLYVIVATFLILFTIKTKQQVKVWKNSETIWTNNLSFQNHIIANINRSTFYVDTKQYKKSLVDIRTILKSKNARNKDKASAYYCLGVIYFEENKFKKAEKNFNEAIKLDEKSYESFYNLGNIFTYKNSYEKAIQNYTNGIKINSEFLSLYKNRANAYYQSGQYNLALKDVNKAINLNIQRPFVKTRDATLAEFKKELLRKLNIN